MYIYTLLKANPMDERVRAYALKGKKNPPRSVTDSVFHVGVLFVACMMHQLFDIILYSIYDWNERCGKRLTFCIIHQQVL
jgi:hypothetical protein